MVLKEYPVTVNPLTKEIAWFKVQVPKENL
jgi:hypothetical protein